MTRREIITERIGTDLTGLKGAVYVHAEFDETGKLDEIRLSEKSKELSTLDLLFMALGDSLTRIIRDAKKPGIMRTGDAA